MSYLTNISWCDSTHNFWRGCTKVSPGCQRCYAEQLVTTRLKGEWGNGAPRVRAKDFDAPLRWNKKPWVCDECGEAYEKTSETLTFHRRRVFSLSLGDWLDDEVPIEWLADMLDVIRRCPNLDFLLLTKRPENWGRRMAKLLTWEGNHCQYEPSAFWCWLHRYSVQGIAPENIWLGTSVEDQQRADERMPYLLKIPAKIRFLSCEPLLGPINLGLDGIIPKDISPRFQPVSQQLHWVIVGGESGPNARPCNIDWIQDIVRQCKAAGVPCFVKQLGSNPVYTFHGMSGDFDQPFPVENKKGGDPAEWPEDLRVQQFPNP